MDVRILFPVAVRNAPRRRMRDMLVLVLAGLALAALPVPVSAQQELTESELAEELYDRGEYRQALQAYDLMLIRTIDDPNVLHRISYSLLKCERWDRAQAVLEHFIEVDPEEPVARYNLGLLHWNMDRRFLAIACFEAIVERDSTYGDAWYCLGLLNIEIGELETAWRIQTRLLAMGHDGAEDLQAALVEYETERSDPLSDWW